MSTRCQVRVIEGQQEDNGDLTQDVLLYHHSDGYPNGECGMIPHFWKAYLFGVTPFVKPWEVDDKDAKPSTFEQWKAYRAGYAASMLCHVDPRGFNPESVKLDDEQSFLHFDIEWYYKLYVIGKKVKGMEYPEWELEIYKSGYGDPVLVNKRTPLSKLINKEGFLKESIFSTIKSNVKKMEMSKEEKAPKNLKFICPECQNNHLECCESNAYVTSEIDVLSNDGDFLYGVPSIQDSTVACFQCTACGYSPKRENGADIDDNLELVEWLKKQEYNK